MIGGTFAWLTQGILGPQTTDFGVLSVESRGIELGANDTDTVIYLQPGYSWPETGGGYISNVGTVDAFVEITTPTVYLTRDIDGKKLTAANGTLDPDTGVYTNIANTDLYEAGYTVLPNDAATEATYVGTDDAAWDVLTNPTIHDVVSHMKLVKDGKERHFLFFNASGKYYVRDDNGDTVYNADGTPAIVTVPAVTLAVQPKLDLATHAIKMGNDWNGAYMKGFKVHAVQGAYQQAIFDVVGLTPADFAALEWADNTTVQLRARSAAPRITPAQFLERYAFAK
jgi:hypothetical protein